MREGVIQNFPIANIEKPDTDKYLEDIEEIYISDAYHSLSIEGYQVSFELIEKVRLGKWLPETNIEDRTQYNALAVRGYWQAFQSVKMSISKVLQESNTGKVIQNDHGSWYREIFQLSVSVGLLKLTDLAGYRRSSVYIINI